LANIGFLKIDAIVEKIKKTKIKIREII